MDFKSGISFHEYAGLAHIATLYALFRAEGADNIADYNRTVALDDLPKEAFKARLGAPIPINQGGIPAWLSS